MILAECFEIPKLEDSILNFQIFIYYQVPSFEIQADIFMSFDSI